MRLTIIPTDKTVIKDGLAYTELDFSMPDASIHAVQWYDTEGELEIVDAKGRTVENRTITDLAPFQSALDAWQVRHNTPVTRTPLIL